MDSDFMGPVNIGSDEMVTIDRLAEMVMEAADKKLLIRHIQGPLGVRGRNSDNRLIQRELAWKPSMKLKEGLAVTYTWIKDEIRKRVEVAIRAVANSVP